MCGVVLKCLLHLGLQREETPVHMAAEYGHSEAVRLLLAADSNPNVENAVVSTLHMLWNCCVV